MNIFYLIGHAFGRMKFETLRGFRDGFSPSSKNKDERIRVLLRQDPDRNYIAAIKLHRELYGSMLRDAKDAVDEMRRNI